MATVMEKSPTMEVTWYELGGPNSQKLSLHDRRCAVDDNGALYLPAKIAATESEVMLCAGFDGAKILDAGDDGLYFPAEWMAKEFPECAECVNRIRAKISMTGPLL